MFCLRFGRTIAACLALTGCALGPDYRPPDTRAPAAWTAPLPHGGSTGGLLGWWDRFEDPALTRLLSLAEADSPSLASAAASIRKARATLTTDRAAGLPSVTAGGSAQRATQTSSGSGGTSVAGTLTGTLDAAWEIDLFGKVRRNAEAAEARIEARQDDWHDARVSLAAEVADDYVQYRACGLLAQAYADAARSQQATAAATERSVLAGFTSPADGALARAGAASAQASLTAQKAECDLLVKSLVDLTGTAEPALRRILDAGPATLPQPAAFVVDAVPAAAIAQRPDLASLERELAAASAEIGAAEADRLPSLSLSGTISRAISNPGAALTSWSLGPALSLPLFDAGKRSAAVDTAEAAYEIGLANYRQGVRTAVKEVEQALVRLDGAANRAADTQVAADGYRRYFDSIDLNWQAGGASLLDREEARRNALNAEITAITVRRDRIEYWIALYKALGGGWQAEAQPSRPGEQS